MSIYVLSKLEEPSSKIHANLLRTLKPHTAPVVTSTIDKTGSLLATGASDGSIKVWDLKRGYTTHTFHGHGGVISALCFFTIPAPISQSDKLIYKNIGRDSTGEISTSGFRLASGSEDGKIRIWDLHKRKGISILDSHVSVVRNLSFSESDNSLLSASRDKTLILWDARTWKARRIVPALESLEAAGFLSDESLCYAAGENGRLRIFDPSKGSEITKDQEVAPEQEAVVSVEYSKEMPFIMTVHSDQSLRLHSIEPLLSLKSGVKINPLPVIRRIAGNDDEVIDMVCAGPDRSLLALATNSEYIRLVSTSSSQDPGCRTHFGADVALLDGHTDIIICLDTDWSGHWLATGAKDNTARLWRIDPVSSTYECVATLTGHAQSLGAVSFPRAPPSSSFKNPLSEPPSFLFTGSQDRTIKRWDLSKFAPFTRAGPAPKATYTRIAHDKDINSLDINHSSTLLASASQDRTVKIWSIEDGAVLGILRGHKRGVWSVRFAPKEVPIIKSTAGSSTNRGVVATASADKTIKVWSLSDYGCLMTFEGHVNSVLKIVWLPPPRIDPSNEDISSRDAVQIHPLIASAAADGLVKVWSPYTGELETTLDNHTDRIWALATPFSPTKKTGDSSSEGAKKDYSLISGGADSVVTFWRDMTSASLSAAVNANTARIEEDQELQNYIHAGKYREAIVIALQLNHPGRLLSLFTTAIDAGHDNMNEDTLTGNSEIDSVLKSLDDEQLFMLLLRLRDWNTNAKTSPVAQRILYALSRSYPSSKFVNIATSRSQFLGFENGRKQKSPTHLKNVLDVLSVYTERHYRRIEELLDESYLVEWILGEMDGMVHGTTGEDDNNTIMTGA